MKLSDYKRLLLFARACETGRGTLVTKLWERVPRRVWEDLIVYYGLALVLVAWFHLR
jgi:hypothetical protein